jgi:hypothetical protein
MSVEHAKMAEKSQKYFLENEKELRLKYGGQYVAIKDEEVVGHNKDHSKLVEDIDQEEDISVDEVFIKFVRQGERKVVR